MSSRYWLMKSEPDVFSIHDLEKVKQEPWSGVRNYQARNFMWQEMQLGDLVVFYHSNAKPSGIAGIAKVASHPYPDPTQFDPQSEYFDAKATLEKPRWWLVDVAHVQTYSQLIPLEALKQHEVLSHMLVCKKGSRLSIVPVDKAHFLLIQEIVSERNETLK
jgi:predicted RNA-binding protein with PUA-like domain